MSRLAKPTRVWARADAGVCSLCPQKQRLFFNSRSVGEECRPDLLTSLMEMSLVLCLPLCRFSSGSHACRFCNSYEVLHFAHFWQGAESIALATQNRIQTSKNGPRLSVFNTFDVEMCFSPQPRALFQARNFQNHSHAHFLIQKRSGPEVVFHIFTSNVLCATAVRTFSTAKAAPNLPTKWLRYDRFSEPTFRLSGATKHIKNTVLRNVSTFSRAWIFFLLALSSLTFPISDLLSAGPLFSDSFSSLTVLTTVAASPHKSEVWLLNFLR